MSKLTEGQKRYRRYREAYIKYRKKHSSLSDLLSKKNYDNKYLFGGNRIKALERDNYKCVKCGMTNEEHIRKYGCEITIDHIDGKGAYSNIKNNKLSNLQTLCLHCHGLKDCVRGGVTSPRKVHQLTMDGKIIRSFDSCMEAYRMTGILNKYISKTLNGYQETAGGYKWKANL